MCVDSSRVAPRASNCPFSGMPDKWAPTTAMGIDSATVRDGDEVRSALDRSKGRPFLIDASINASDYKDVMKLARG